MAWNCFFLLCHSLAYKKLFRTPKKQFKIKNLKLFSNVRPRGTHKGRVQKPQSRFFAVMGVPPPSPHHGKRPAKKLTGKKSRQRGVPPPPPSRQAAWNFFAKNGVFCLKNTVFGPIFNIFFLCGKGGYPPITEIFCDSCLWTLHLVGLNSRWGYSRERFHDACWVQLAREGHGCTGWHNSA